MLVLSRNPGYPVSDLEMALTPPCWDASINTIPYRPDIDYSFQRYSNQCSKSYKGSVHDVEYKRSDFHVNEFDILQSNGILEDLMYYRRGWLGRDYYAAESHRRYEYNLYERAYTYWNPVCTNFGVGPKEIDSLSAQTGSVSNWFIGLIATCFVSMAALLITSFCKAGADEGSSGVNRKVVIIQTIIVLAFNIATSVLAWTAWGKAEEVDTEMIRDVL